tara:strand:+ start:414 stop:1076 length:663 start_codon:yes stop_codon:yes gene_type:complete
MYLNKNSKKLKKIPIKYPRIWIYKLQGSYKNCTEDELNISKSLNPNRKIVFLETRSYIRESLSQFYNCHPLEIPLKALPGKSPVLLKNLGYISISHCKDAFLVSLFEDNIGVDIERTDREFNHVDLAKRYFYKFNKHKISKENVLFNWTSIEAAIKWDKGTLAKDLSFWEIKKKEKVAFNIRKKISVDISQFIFMYWTISLAFNRINHRHSDIICSEFYN